jgi:hypothetical protein
MMNTKLSAIMVLVIGACDAQVDSDHQGQVLATLDGTMQTTHAAQTIEVDVSVVWVIGSGGTSFVGADKVEVQGSLPSNFSLSIFTPPTDDLMTEWDGIKFGAAFVAVSPAGVDPHEWQRWRGVENDHVLVYLPEAPPAGSDVAALLHGTTSAGFHLYDVRKLTEAERQQRLDCFNQLYHSLGHEPALAEVVDTCGGTANDDLTLAADDLDTRLSIQIVDQFGLDEFNALPSWYGL